MRIRTSLWIVSLVASLLAVPSGCVGNGVYNYKRDIANQQIIADAYVKFYVTHHEFPASLAALVSAGYLPSNARFYRDVTAWFFQPAVDYRDGSYEVFPPADGDVASLKMLGRRRTFDGRTEWEFNPTVNASIRDGVSASHSTPP